MSIIIEPGKVIPFADLPPRSIALDGYVMGPAIDNAQQRYSFDHHGGCLRLATRATCAQVFDALHLGLDPTGLNVYLNDLDGDTLLSVWLLQNPAQIQQPHVQQLLADLDKVDAHGPAYTLLQNPERIQQFFQGVLQGKALAQQLNQAAEHQKAALMHEALEQALKRLERFVAGENFATEPVRPPTFKLIYEKDGWIMVESQDYVFFHLYHLGHTRIVAYSQIEHKPAQLSYAYTLAKKSDLVGGFDIPAILSRLSEIEPGWGGGSSIGGAPRRTSGARSFLKPQEVIEVIEACLKK